MSDTKPGPVFPQVVTKLCPICGKAAYSFGGIHPQCAVQQADEPRTLRLRAARKAEIEAANRTGIKPKKKAAVNRSPQALRLVRSGAKVANRKPA